MMNSRQLVLCRDSSNGLALVGWSIDLPPGRFDHIDILGESMEAGPLVSGHPAFEMYQKGCRRARQLNNELIATQERINKKRGWIRVLPDIQQAEIKIFADSMGSYMQSAQQSAQRITPNNAPVWAKVHDGVIRQIRSQSCGKDLNELEYEVWKHRCWEGLAIYPGDILSGLLAVEISGLWFIADRKDLSATRPAE